MTNVERPRVSVTIPTYNRSELLRRSLEQLTRQSLPTNEFEVIVADDGSSDDTKAVAESFAERLNIKYYYQEDIGFRAGEARNAGARLSSAPLLVFIDTGQMAGPDFLASHLAAHADGGRRAVVGYAHGYNPVDPMPGIREALEQLPPEQVLEQFKDNPAFVDVRHWELAKSNFDLSSRTMPWFMFWTLNCSVRAEDFAALGGFDESFSGWGAEDLEFGYRLHANGVRLELSRDAWVIDAPHERDWPKNLQQFGVNLIRFVDKYRLPMIEIGWALSTRGEILPWESDYLGLLEWTKETKGLDVRDEIAAAVRDAAPDARIAVLGSGGAIPDTLPPAVLLDFDEQLLADALADGKHTGHHTMGLRTPLADDAVDLVVITSRMAGLWERWGDILLSEAQRIGRAVRVPDFAVPSQPS